MTRDWVGVLVAAALAGCVTRSEPKGIVVRVAGPVDDCRANWNGEGVDASALEAVATAWPDERTPVRIIGDASTPWRCVGGLIYNLQRIGFRDIRFVQDTASKHDAAE